MLTRRLVFLLFPITAACGGSSAAADSPPEWSPEEAAEAPAGEATNDSHSSDSAKTADSDAAGAEPADELDPESHTQNSAEDPKPPGNTVQETRTTKVIQGVVVQNRQLVRNCYERELKRSPALQGTLTIHFEIDPKGHVSLAEVNEERSTLKHPAVTACALSEVKKFRFPPSSRGFESAVNYPFDFNP